MQEGNKDLGWNSKNVEASLVLLLNLLGAGKGGTISLQVDYQKFVAPSHSSMVENVDLIRSIFSHFNLDMKAYNRFPEPEAQVDELQLEDQHLVHEVQPDRVEEEEVELRQRIEEDLDDFVHGGDQAPAQAEFLFEANVDNNQEIQATEEDLQAIAQVEDSESGGQGDDDDDDLPEPQAPLSQVIVQRSAGRKERLMMQPRQD